MQAAAGRYGAGHRRGRRHRPRPSPRRWRRRARRCSRADLAEADLSRPGEPLRLAQEAIRSLGRVSIFVHCASPRRQESQKALQVSEAEWREMLEVNLNAGFIIAQALGNHMVEQHGEGAHAGDHVAARWSPRNLPHYSAAKAGQTMLVKELARALGPHGIRVNAIAPGAIPGGGFAAPPGMAEKIPLRPLRHAGRGRGDGGSGALRALRRLRHRRHHRGRRRHRACIIGYEP